MGLLCEIYRNDARPHGATHLFQGALREAVFFQVKVTFHWKKKKNRLVVDAYNLFITNHLFKVIWNKSASNEYKWDTEQNEQTLGERMKVKSHSVGINTN